MQLAEMTWPQVDRLSRTLPVVIPIAAIEQHGHHLPLITDTLLLNEIVSRAEKELGSDVLMIPVQWYGNSHHHMDFPGTLSAPPRVYLDLIVGLVQNMIDHGFQRIFVLNGHGGNDVPGRQAGFELRQRHRQRKDLLLLFSTYWSLADSPRKHIPELVQAEMSHACEWETSMMLRIAPHMVGDYKAVNPVPPGSPFRPASRAWITKDRSIDGHVGQPNEASPEKGEQLLSYFSDSLIKMVRRVEVWDGHSWDG